MDHLLTLMPGDHTQFCVVTCSCAPSTTRAQICCFLVNTACFCMSDSDLMYCLSSGPIVPLSVTEVICIHRTTLREDNTLQGCNRGSVAGFVLANDSVMNDTISSLHAENGLLPRCWMYRI